MRQNISLAKITLLAAYSYGYHEKRSEKRGKKRRKAAKKGKKARKNKRKGEESKRKREEKLRKRKESERKREESEEKQEKKRRKTGKRKESEEKQEKRRRKRGKRRRKALHPVFLTKDKAERLWFGGARARPMQPAYFDILALAFSTSSSLGRGSFLASITTWKTKSATHFCEKPRRWLY